MTEPRKIYVVEDSPLHVKLIQSVLEEHPEYRVEFFSDGLQAYLRVLAAPPDLMILDIILPTLSGLATARLLKFHESYRQIPILMMSSISEPDVEEWAGRVGADRFIAKPLQLARFLAYVEELLPRDGLHAPAIVGLGVGI